MERGKRKEVQEAEERDEEENEERRRTKERTNDRTNERTNLDEIGTIKAREGCSLTGCIATGCGRALVGRMQAFFRIYGRDIMCGSLMGNTN